MGTSNRLRNSSTIYAFGGIKFYGGYAGYLNEVISLNAATSTWNPVVSTTTGPNPRASHAAVKISDTKLCILWGYDLIYLNDVWCLDVSASPAQWNAQHPLQGDY
eukprot:TRINITY_DN718_c0_g1_i2.p1 TRINITY_DN718_c0_g1~~TRINITY_DN718_c0_g1_i2.p1  ORF type:complete len:105 (+),score=15.38 TRINITY_DN718_c0_g1_i2:1798-2112(+)